MKKIYLLIFIAIIGCNKSTDNSTLESEKKAIRNMFKDWVEVCEQTNVDVNNYLQFTTEDFIFLGPGSKPISNKDTLYNFLDNFFREYYFSFPNWTTDEIIISGDLAIHRYSGIAYFISKMDSSKFEADRKYVDILRKTSTGWKASRHMFNLNK